MEVAATPIAAPGNGADTYTAVYDGKHGVFMLSMKSAAPTNNF